MAFTDRKLETAIFALTVVMVAGLGYSLKSPVQNAIMGGDVSYEMPRIKKSFLASLFDLGDREIERTYTNPFAKKKAEEKKKAIEAKKAQVAAAAKAAAAKVVAKKAEDAKKSKVEVKVVEAAPTKKWADDGFFGGGSPYAGQVAGTAGPTKDSAKDKKSDMTASQWVALMQNQPTPENMAKLIAAFQAEEVDADTYYKIIDDLFKRSNSDTQALALLGVKAVFAPKSFMITVQNLDKISPNLHADAEKYLKSYAVAGRLSALAAVMKSSDTDSVLYAMDVVIAGYNAAKSGTTVNTDPRNSRGDVVTNSLGGYSQFVAIFDSLRSSSDAAIAQQANSQYSQIQGASTSAVAAL